MLEKLKQEILEKMPANSMPVKIITIDGHGGSGKTTLANALARLLKAEVIHTDDFASYDNPMDWYPRMIRDVLEPIRHGSVILNYDRGSWYKNHNPLPVVNQPVTPILLIEGVSSSRKEFRSYITYSIWVDTPPEICIMRGIERDMSGNPSGKTAEEIKADWDKWHAYELVYIKRDEPSKYADSIYSGLGDVSVSK